MGVFCVLAAGSIDDSNTSNNTTPSSGTASPAASQAPALKVSAGKLFVDYQTNEIAADSVYKGRSLMVTGSVSSISKDFAGSPYILLATSDEFMPVHANLKEIEAPAAATLSPGDVVIVVCKGDGMVLGSPILSDCVFQRQTAYPVPQNSTGQEQ
jgi:hypothetical protein